MQLPYWNATQRHIMTAAKCTNQSPMAAPPISGIGNGAESKQAAFRIELNGSMQRLYRFCRLRWSNLDPAGVTDVGSSVLAQADQLQSLLF